jgi:hypothetical protein
MKILLVSDVHHFSTYDVFKGYIDAFNKLEVPFEIVDLVELNRWYSPEMSWGLVIAKMLNKENAFTDILFISGILTPDWLLNSKYDKKVGIIGLDDPHAGKILLNKLKYLDYYFTNCKKMEDKENNIFYLPTATTHILPTVAKSDVPEDFKCDICFIGTVYEDRIKPLEEICEFAEKKNLKIKIIGPLLSTSSDSIIRKYAQEGIIPNSHTKLIYRGAQLVINIDRNVNWNPCEKDGNSTLVDVGEPYSTNPRVYEIAGCKTTQFYINPRQEVKDIFGNNIFYSDYNNIKEKLEEIFNTDPKILLEKSNNCFNIIKDNHTYINRTRNLLEYIRNVSIKKMEKIINN